MTATVGPFQLRTVSLRDWIVLLHEDSPFLGDQLPTPQQLAEFLWHFSPERNAGESRELFMRFCKWLFFPPYRECLWTDASAVTRRRFALTAEIIDACRAHVHAARPPDHIVDQEIERVIAATRLRSDEQNTKPTENPWIPRKS